MNNKMRPSLADIFRGWMITVPPADTDENAPVMSNQKTVPRRIHPLGHCERASPGCADSPPQPHIIHLHMNVDGKKLHINGTTIIWPILVRIVRPLTNPIFLVGLYGGVRKPEDVCTYLHDVAQELEELLLLGVVVNELHHKVMLDAIICDKPARSFVTRMRGHNSYYGCDKCCIKAQCFQTKIAFPYGQHVLRTDNTIRRDTRNREPNPVTTHTDSRTHKEKGVNRSPPYHRQSWNTCSSQVAEKTRSRRPDFCQGTPIYDKLPFDPLPFSHYYMHAVCLGVVCSLVSTFVNVRIGPAGLNRINRMIRNIRATMPVDFPRKCREITLYKQRKATEFHQPLFYIGPIVFSGILSQECYQNFIDLFISVYCRSHRHYSVSHLDYSRQLLVIFVDKLQELCGSQEMVYNVHCLLHLPDDGSSHGSLNNFSAFPYESYMFTPKRPVQSPTYPVRQIYERLQESEPYLKMPRAYSLVKFYEQGLCQCAVLSSSWIEGNCAAWPKVHSKDFYKAARLHLEPPAGSMKLTCEVIRTHVRCHVDCINFSDDFKKAREYGKFEYTSDLDISDVTVEEGRGETIRVESRTTVRVVETSFRNIRERSPTLSIGPSPKKPRLMVSNSPPYPNFSQTTHRALFHLTPERDPQHSASVPSTSKQPAYLLPQTVHRLPHYVLSTSPAISIFPVLSPQPAPFYQTPGVAAPLRQNEQLLRKMDAMAEDLRYPKIRTENPLLQVHVSAGTLGFTFPLRS
ncbi:hypothetical protein T265_04578 [Opisthorchis viverrini]|uniref:Uncharacterized protein n=1 Tax=Opisthorchis viverrini TaxID=6198 RepID=A0A074ZZA0_OPIVI|nr:hypothetical protein T265_04578 [Opisthorchis viverrini]KER28625.1 hypothetical protein T265_04578 [Opisthorchis viverrini]